VLHCQPRVFTLIGLQVNCKLSASAFKTARRDENGIEHHSFGLWDPYNRSLVVAKDDWLTSYGNPGSGERLMSRLQTWLDLGMPNASCFDLKVFPIDARVEVGAGANGSSIAATRNSCGRSSPEVDY
jgi:hypothetical protein